MTQESYREFLPAVLEVQETPPSPVGRIILRTIMVLLVTAVVWSACGDIDIVAISRGKVVVSELSRPVSSAVMAEVESVLVRDGMKVKKGQPLIRLNSRALDARYEENALRQKINRFHIARLTLLLQHYQDQPAEEKLPAIFYQEDEALARQLSAQLMSEAENDRQEKAVLRDKMSVLKAQKVWYASQKAQSESLLPVYNEQYQALATLYKKQLTSRDSLLEKQKQLTEARYTLESAQAKLTEMDVSYHQAETEYRARIAEKMQQVEQDISDKQHENRVLEKQLQELSAQIAQYTLKAPVSGIVDALLFRDGGAAVDAPQELLRIVPENETLTAEVMVSNSDIGFLHSGQNVTVKIDTFDFTRYGWVPGRLIKLSADAIEDKELGLVYKATIELNKKSLVIDGQPMRLEPGMQVTAEITTGTRTILSYLLSPVMEALDSVGKQR
ncbi:HlyD family type I secretion periplasmic adaptor subunit [Kluyvera ascorbata]|jgi:hemolysin D|uniref:HlyD family type I secretion periplasmic adaptor subunit n=1 Tax=Kluyvera ascorbata TaxID=51288 RepID=UPI00289A46E2|nr:HlyD family type I secretion periplasmic adaptor subunit [Kluyvera ascorbata]HEB4876667.1 HlyD family type I secretion periplasmic adaptor subunit [Kluyvera ascorbata F0526]MDT8701954.1 HlyD family type I secretion periplasmic adaptor subunit [Kluyvera ascorbata]MEB6390878.1 HlyD family type I secretion periplasmic adaptor subunit [Kluyvera ascorbata]HDG1670036.1 HlyD family type I secretion periplasmic adaptor subunit [Kluyvera ascorbata]HDG1697506.1 HlyD family type I secretion periplasmi